MHLRFHMEFSTGNAAFDDGNGPAEVARILREAAERVEDGDESCSVYDTNGNRVGSWAVDFPETDEDDS